MPSKLDLQVRDVLASIIFKDPNIHDISDIYKRPI